MKDCAIRRENAPHYTWGQGCDGWFLVQDTSLTVIEEQMPPQTSERLHFHEQAQQFFYMLSGEAVMEVAGVEVRLPAGQGLSVKPEVHHRIKNLSQQPIRFLVISQPPSHGDRVDRDGKA